MIQHNAWQRIRQRFCAHACYLEDMVENKMSELKRISCNCYKCGKLLEGAYGLSFGCKWERRNNEATHTKSKAEE